MSTEREPEAGYERPVSGEQNTEDAARDKYMPSIRCYPNRVRNYPRVSSTWYSSAAGEVSDTGSADNAVLGGVVCDDDQPDLSAGLVHQLDEAVIAIQQRAAGGGSDECDDAPNDVHSIQTKQEVDVEVVGTTPEVLDSFNELIKFDHMYYKKPLAVETPTVSNITAARSPNPNSTAVAIGNSTSSHVKFEQVSPEEMLYNPEECLTFSEDFGNAISEEFGLADPDLNRISELLDQLASEATPKDTEKLPPALFDTSDELFLDKVLQLSYQTPMELEDNNESFLSDDLSSSDRPDVSTGQNVIHPSSESVDSALELDIHSAPTSPDEGCFSSPNSDFESKPESPFSLAGTGVDLITETNYHSPHISVPSPASSLDSAFESTTYALPDFLDDLVFSTETNYNCPTVASDHSRPAGLLGLGIKYDNFNNSNWCNSEFDWGESCSDLNLDTDLFPSLYSLA